MTAAQTSNKRRYERVYLGTDVPVLDVLMGEEIGKVVNLTVEGMMLALREPQEPGAIYQLALILPEDLEATDDAIYLGADCLWCSATSAGGYFWAGLQILDASLEAQTLIGQLIDNYAID